MLVWRGKTFRACVSSLVCADELGVCTTYDTWWARTGITCVTREQEHNPKAMSFQGGPNTGDHVDIMGNHDVIADVLKVVAGQGHTLDDRIVSNLHQIVARTDL